MRSTAEDQARLEAQDSSVEWADLSIQAPASQSSRAAATSSAISPFDLPPQTVSLAESAAVRSPFEFSDAAVDMTNASSTAISQSAFANMCAELVGALYLSIQQLHLRANAC